MAQEVISLTGTSIIVTGGGRGLGRAMVEALAGAGASVLAVDKDAEPLDELRREVAGDIVGHQADVTSEVDAMKSIDASLKAFDRLDVVINNAGIGMSSLPGGDHVPFYEIHPDWLRQFFEVHVLGSFNFSKAALPHLRQQGHGRIITITTSLWFMLEGENTPYGPVKAAMESLASAMYHDLENTGITVNVLVPGGGADTRFVKTAPGESRDHLIKPAVMGPPAVFLASSLANDVNGRRIVAKDWDPSLPVMEALERSSAPIGWPGAH